MPPHREQIGLWVSFGRTQLKNLLVLMGRRIRSEPFLQTMHSKEQSQDENLAMTGLCSYLSLQRTLQTLSTGRHGGKEPFLRACHYTPSVLTLHLYVSPSLRQLQLID